MARYLKLLALICIGCMATALTACGEGSSTQSSSTVLTGEEGRPEVPVPAGPPPAKLVVDDIEKGSGPPAKEGDEMSVRYFRFGYKNHRIYEDHWNQRPTSFTLGGGEMVDAWEAGLRGMKAGGRRELILPEKMTFGGAAEIYVIDALSVKPSKLPDETGPNASLRKVKGTGATPKIKIPPGPPPKELVVRELKKGSGRGAVRGERLGVRSLGVNYKTHRVQSLWSSNPPYSFVLGAGTVRKGWEIGLKGMKLGARRELLLPSRLAYGDGPMVYVVELLEMEKPTPRRQG
jgi:FKBP-type peptidyl-prolyl cis-trans isomerase